MVVYIGLILTIFLFFILSKSSNRKIKKNNMDTFYYTVTLILLSIFSGIRYMVGWDWIAYYNTIEYNALTNIVDRGELLNIFLIELSQKNDFTYLYFLVTSFIIIFCIGLFIKKYSENKWMSLYLFVTFPLFFLNSLSVIRFFVALAITLCGVKYIEEKNIIKYILVIIIASQFHKTALLCICFYFVDKINLKRFQYILILCACPFFKWVSISIVNKFFPMYQAYLSNTGNIQEGTKAIIIVLLLGIVSILFYEVIEKNSNILMFFKIYFIGICIYLMFASYGTLGHRLSLYGTIYMIVIIPYLIKHINVYPKYVLVIGINGLFTLAYFYTLFVGSEAYLPYKTFFEFL